MTQVKRTKTDLSKFESGNVGAEIGEAEFYKELIYHTSSPPVAEEKTTEVRIRSVTQSHDDAIETGNTAPWCNASKRYQKCFSVTKGTHGAMVSVLGDGGSVLTEISGKMHGYYKICSD